MTIVRNFNMIVLLTITFFLTASAQESAGSIFAILDDDSLTDEEQAEMASNVEEKEELSSVTSSTSTSPTNSSSLSNPSTESSLSIEELEEMNEYLLSVQSELESQLSDATSKLEAYKSDFANEDESLQEKITNLNNYNHYLIKDQKDKQDEAESLINAQNEQQESDENDEDEIELSESTIFVIALGVLFLLLQGIRSLIGFSIHSFLNQAFYSLFVDVTILLVICTIASICYYIELFDSDSIDYSLIIMGIALFTFFWLLLGIWFIIAAQSFSGAWIKHEKSCLDLRSLTHMFQEAQIDIAEGVVPRRLKEIYQDFQYAIMRQLFICPTFLPPVTETYLRTDFNLAEYLSRSIAEVIKKVFALSWLGYSLIIVAVIG